ncbi:MAG: hypothetical protein AAFP69_03270 [Planctomycetota bacterium]
MATPLSDKSSIDEIRSRFDNDVERFSSLDTGQAATIDAPLAMALMWQRYGDYLVSIGDEAYRDKVFQYTDREDSPRPVTYQLDLLRSVGFSSVDLLHKNSCIEAFGAIKPA